jgi:hypothetical protein
MLAFVSATDRYTIFLRVRFVWQRIGRAVVLHNGPPTREDLSRALRRTP